MSGKSNSERIRTSWLADAPSAVPRPEKRRLSVAPAPPEDPPELETPHISANAWSAKSLRRRLMLADAAALLVGTAFAFAVQAIFSSVPRYVTVGHLVLVVASLPVFALVATVNRMYQARANARPAEEATNILKTVGMTVSWILVVALAAQYDRVSRLWVASFAVGVAAALLIERRAARNIFARLRREGRLERRIVIVGTDDYAVNLARDYQSNRELGYTVVGFAGDDEVGNRTGTQLLGPVKNLLEILEETDAVGVVVSLHSIGSDSVNSLTRTLTDRGYHVALSSSLCDIDVNRLRPQSLNGHTMIYVERIVRGGWRGAAKRLFDVVLALSIMIVTLPIQVLAAIAIACTSRGPVFFRQIRVGKDGELFELFKFRTMYADAEQRKASLLQHNEADGPLFKMKDDPRITPVGRLLRKLSIDELPQLLCVLLGSMSMVGPRPALPAEFDQWDEDVCDRLRVLPGLTGMWQVSGRSDSSFETYKRLDLYYVDNWSLLHDLKICLRTIPVVLRGSGAC